MKSVSFGKYIFEKKIAQGGMGEIFLAKHIGEGGFEKLVAIKRILPHLSHDEGFISMFLDEARTSALLNHPNIVHIYELDKFEDSYYIAMEYVDGPSLKTVLEKEKARNSLIPIDISAYIVSSICNGLNYAHNKTDLQGNPLHIVHRDISPHNILLSYQGEVKIADFGIARAIDRISSTSIGVIKGKVAYMSPEQAEGEHIDARSDIFSLGILFFEMLTGRSLFERETTIKTLHAITKEEEIFPPSKYNPQVPPELDKIVLKALERNLEKRYNQAIDMEYDIENFLKSKGDKLYTTHVIASYLKELFGNEQLELPTNGVMFESTVKSSIPQYMLTQEENQILDSLNEVKLKGSETKSLNTDIANISTISLPQPNPKISKRILSLFKKRIFIYILIGLIFSAIFTYLNPDRLERIKENILYQLIGKGHEVIVSIYSKPEDATLIINGEERDKTPTYFKVTSPNVSYNIEVKKEGYYKWNDTLFIDKKIFIYKNAISVKAELIPITGKINIITNPSGASVKIDNTVYKNKTPINGIELSYGNHTISVSKKGYILEKQEIKIDEKNLIYDLNISLKKKVEENIAEEEQVGLTTSEELEEKEGNIPEKDEIEFGKLKINSNPAGAEVYIDEVFQGTTPLVLTYEHKIKTGKHILKFIFEGISSEEIDIEVKEGEEFKYFYYFQGDIEVDSDEDVQVYLDENSEELYDIPHTFKKIPYGEHTVTFIKIKNGQKLEKKKNIIVKPNEKVYVEEYFEK